MSCLFLLELLGKGCFQFLQLTVESIFPLADFFFVRDFLCFQLFLKVLHIRFLDVTLSSQFDDVIDQPFLSAVADNIAKNRHNNNGYDCYNLVYFHTFFIYQWQRYKLIMKYELRIKKYFVTLRANEES